MRFEIFEGNMERLEKKVATIQNKAKKYGCEVKFEKVGEVIKETELDNGTKEALKYIVIEAEGTAKVNNWEYVATIDHTVKGNIINGTGKYEVPERYYYGACKCEHCKTDRMRAFTYIVRNSETEEFKQVGKSCLRDYTNGLSTEAITQYYSFFEKLAEFESPIGGGLGWHDKYLHTIEFLNYVAECVEHFGYVKSEGNGESTKDRAYRYYATNHGMYDPYYCKDVIKRSRREMDDVNFNPDKHEGDSNAVVEWAKNLPDDSNYNHNLKVACSEEYVTYGKLGLIASAATAMNKWKEAEKAKESEKQSEYVGNIGERITFDAEELKVVTCWESIYGITYIIKITDKDGNVFTWKTQNGGKCDGQPHKVTGTIKDHSEYRGVKQTELTRCKIA